jgi:hypothetical protein
METFGRYTFHCVEKNVDQPVWRVVLRLPGRLVFFTERHCGIIHAQEQCTTLIKDKQLDENTCHTLCVSFELNHHEGTGNLTLFSSGIFKVQHAQLVQALLVSVDYESSLMASKNLLLIAMNELLLARLTE